ncbi:MAG: SDR family oxidoreductase [Gammaproteobacteria bacterium]|nr:SDR family oxidoreductase [Gammaproteobacteria bacterium]
MKILIIGSTGTIGSELLNQSLSLGHEVTAFARNPTGIALAHPALSIVQGDVMDPASLERAMLGHDAVLIALGVGAKGNIRARGTQNVITAMHHCGIRRLICLSSLGVGDSRENLNFFWKYLMFGLLLRRAYADHVAQEAVVRDSGLDWTIVRPGAYIDGTITQNYQHGFPPQRKKLKLKISRADVAHFMLRQLGNDEYLGASPGLSY